MLRPYECVGGCGRVDDGGEWRSALVDDDAVGDAAVLELGLADAAPQVKTLPEAHAHSTTHTHAGLPAR